MKYLYYSLLVCIQGQLLHAMDALCTEQSCLSHASSLHMAAQAASSAVSPIFLHFTPTWTKQNIGNLFQEGRLNQESLPRDVAELISPYISFLPSRIQLSPDPQIALLTAVLSENSEFHNPFLLAELIKQGADINAPLTFNNLEQILKILPTSLLNDNNEEPTEVIQDVMAESLPVFCEGVARVLGYLSAEFRRRAEDVDKKYKLPVHLRKFIVCEGHTPLMLCAFFGSEQGLKNLLLFGADLYKAHIEKTTTVLSCALDNLKRQYEKNSSNDEISVKKAISLIEVVLRNDSQHLYPCKKSQEIMNSSTRIAEFLKKKMETLDREQKIKQAEDLQEHEYREYKRKQLSY